MATSPPYLRYFDRHMIYPVLDFLQESGSYDQKEILQAKFDLLQDTNMPGHCAELYKQINDVQEAPASFGERQAQVDEQLAALETSCGTVLDVLEKQDVKSALRQDKSQNLTFLRESHGVTIDQINQLYKLGQFDYQRGNYAGAIDHLYHFRVLSTDTKLVASATWGKLAAEILTANWDEAMSELSKVKEIVDSDSTDAKAQLRNRVWLMHWALFPFYNAESAKVLELQDLFFSTAYTNAIINQAPHLLRYLVVAVLTSSIEKTGNYQRRIRDLVRIVDAKTTDSDAFTSFALVVFSTHDFAQAPKLLSQIREQVAGDYFLHDSADAIIKTCQLALLQAYLTLHQNADLNVLMELAGVSDEAALTEMLQTDLEQLLDIDVDEEEKQVEVIKRKSGATDQRADVIAKTRSLIERSQYLHSVHQQQLQKQQNQANRGPRAQKAQ